MSCDVTSVKKFVHKSTYCRLLHFFSILWLLSWLFLPWSAEMRVYQLDSLVQWDSLVGGCGGLGIAGWRRGTVEFYHFGRGRRCCCLVMCGACCVGFAERVACCLRRAKLDHFLFKVDAGRRRFQAISHCNIIKGSEETRRSCRMFPATTKFMNLCILHVFSISIITLVNIKRTYTSTSSFVWCCWTKHTIQIQTAYLLRVFDKI